MNGIVADRWDVARIAWVASRVLTGLGIALAAYYWWQLTQDGGSPVDSAFYWSADPSNLYPHPELLHERGGPGYNYAPAFEILIGWTRHLPFAAFVALFRALLVVTLVWLAGPLTLFVLFLPPVASEINAANIQILLAAAIVLSFRKPDWWGSTWAFVLLTKVSPGIGLLWFALRREWRRLAWAVGFTGAIVIVTFAIWPDRWFGWLRLLTAGSPPPVWPFYWSIWVRLPFSIAFVLLGAWRGWRWPVVVAGALALPVFFFISPSMLVGVLPSLREAAGRWIAAHSTPALQPAPQPAEVSA
jgi:Glycosyltransferase family 87